ncbi:hypothetical protein PF008_g30641 [Phytophthora fragariae]|uniref:Uncharacterized protein n=1 Tax=Phytophthora fragariae TaxID=53985 RepID=A0A6G0Q5S2_9STRA|nr:hypothetical protein PF008_g30641 [Phytophthora fragariae]
MRVGCTSSAGSCSSSAPAPSTSAASSAVTVLFFLLLFFDFFLGRFFFDFTAGSPLSGTFGVSLICDESATCSFRSVACSRSSTALFSSWSSLKLRLQLRVLLAVQRLHVLDVLCSGLPRFLARISHATCHVQHVSLQNGSTFTYSLPPSHPPCSS